MRLRDDGTLDTVVCCSKCGEEERFTFDGESFETYDDFVGWALAVAEEDHVCEDRGMGDDGNGAGEGF